MKLLDSLITRVGVGLDIFADICFGFFEKPEIMAFSIGKSCANYLSRLLVNNDLSL